MVKKPYSFRLLDENILYIDGQANELGISRNKLVNKILDGWIRAHQRDARLDELNIQQQYEAYYEADEIDIIVHEAIKEAKENYTLVLESLLPYRNINTDIEIGRMLDEYKIKIDREYDQITETDPQEAIYKEAGGVILVMKTYGRWYEKKPHEAIEMAINYIEKQTSLVRDAIMEMKSLVPVPFKHLI